MKKNLNAALAAVLDKAIAGCRGLGRWLLMRPRPTPPGAGPAIEDRPSNVTYVNWRRDDYSATVKDNPHPNRVVTGVAAIVLALLSIGLYSLLAGSSEQTDRTIETALDQPRTVLLPDGSIVKLSRQSQIKIEYVGEQRVVRLLWGQALFDVEPDKHRPFTVKARGVDTTAVGTRFTVSIETASVNVDVHEGVVIVGPEGTSDEAPKIELTKGKSHGFPVQPLGPVAR
jgi:ferric-dicitrate binding protein FerR (iron transport regulator)